MRARKAKQSGEDEIEAPAVEPDLQRLTEAAPAAARDTSPTGAVPAAHESTPFFSESAYPRRRRTEANPRASFSSASLQSASSDNPIVQAALSRARRASENASRALLPRIESSRPLPKSATNSFAVDRGEATARVLDPAPEINSSPQPASIPDQETTPAAEPERLEHTSPRRIVPAPPIIDDGQQAYDTETVVGPIDELEPCDYLEAEVRRVDKALSAEFSRNESPSLGTHAVINILDLLVVAVSCLPFLAAIALTSGSFGSTQTLAAVVAIFSIVLLFYLGLTHCLCGRTVGMMLTNTRIVDAATFGDPTRKSSLIRAVSYFVAIAPAMIGLLWMAGNRKRRGWHDFISGTFVARDF
ncbi:MAG: RDD family protein [Acidobacteriota bacterium]